MHSQALRELANISARPLSVIFERWSDQGNFRRTGRKQIFLLPSKMVRERIQGSTGQPASPWSLCRSKSREGSQRQLRDWSISCEERPRELGLLILEKRRLRRILSVCRNIWQKNIKKMSQMLPSGAQWKDKNRHKLNMWNSTKHEKKPKHFFYCEDGQTLEQVAQRCCGVSIC